MDSEKEFYSALSHEIRRKIIKLIGNQGCSFTTLKKALMTSTGTIYHHLEALKDLIYQEKNKKYHLTTLGGHAYKILDRNIDTIESTKVSDRRLKSPLAKNLLSLTPKKLFLRNPKDDILLIMMTLAIILMCAILAGLSGLGTFLLFFQETVELPMTLDPFSQLILGLIFVLNYFILFALAELFCFLFYGKRENSIKLLLNFGLIYIPILIYLVIHFILVIFELNYLTILDNILLIFFQIWSLWLLTFNLSVNKYIRIERALIVSLIIHYGAFITLFIISL